MTDEEFSALAQRLEKAATVLRAGDSRLQAIARRPMSCELCKRADYGYGTVPEPYGLTTADERLAWANRLVEDLRTLL